MSARRRSLTQTLDYLFREWPWTFVWFISIMWITFVVIIVTRSP